MYNKQPVPTAIDYGDLPKLLGYQLRRAQLRVFQHFAATLGQTSITPGRYGLLVLIEGNTGISQTALARAAGIERSTLGGVIDHFEKEGLVARRVAPSDRRSYALQLTARGRQLLDKLRPQIQHHEAEVTAQLTAAEARELIQLLARISESD